MHSYQFHIGDYIKNAGHLSLLEDLAYRRLLDFYYDKESAIPNDIQMLSRRLRIGSDEIQTVLNEFFYLDENHWKNERCDHEIIKYHEWIEKQRSNGKLGGRPKKTQALPIANPNETQTEPKKSLTVNRKPLTINQETKEQHLSDKSDAQSGFESFWTAYPKKVGRGAAEKAWKRAKVNGSLSILLNALDKQKITQQWTTEGGKFIPHPTTWLNEKRWLDETTVSVAKRTLDLSIFKD